MNPAVINKSVRELGVMRPRLRRGLGFRVQEYAGKRCCVINDTLHSKFYRIGLPERHFITFLDGRRTFAEAHARASLAAGPEALTEEEAVTLISWLVEQGLADFGSTPEALLEEREEKRQRGKLGNFLNLLFIRLPMGNPDRFLDRLISWLGWVFHSALLTVWALGVATGLWEVAANWDRIAGGFEGVLTLVNGCWMVVIWITLKAIHELSHGLASKHYGCPVREWGICLILFLPVTYVDATASWNLPSKWRRMHVASAGMMSELFVASLAVVVWASTSEGLLNTLAFDTFWMAGIVTLLFNANPLMRFDGYYLLSDALEVPNLSEKSQGLLGRLGARYGLGFSWVEKPDFRERETWQLLAYGIPAFLWRTIVVFSLIVAAAALFKGGGLALALVGAVSWMTPTVSRFARTMMGAEPARRLLMARRGVPRLAALLLVVTAVAFFPLHPAVTAPALLQCRKLTTLRAECPGFINRMLVSDYETVKAGQSLVEMRNLDEETNLNQLAIKVRTQEIKRGVELEGQNLADFQAESSSLDALRKQLGEEQNRLDSLNVVSPIDGTVLRSRLEQRIGSFVPAGGEILSIGVLPASELKIAVSESDIDFFRQQVGQPIDVLIAADGSVFTASLDRVTAHASRDISHPELTALAGGPLGVARREPPPASPESPTDAYELVDPTFDGTATLTGEIPPELRSGQLARVKFHAREGIPIWKRGYAMAYNYFSRLLHKAGRAAEANSIF